jgi:hypothetical protein
MSLPKINKPIFSMLVPSQKKEVRFRPFLVREEKILLIAQQGGTDKEMINALKQILTNCIIDSEFDVDDLTTFDLEYMFLKLRAKSVSNIIKVSYQDAEDVESKVYDFDIDLDSIEIEFDPAHENKIEIGEGIGMIMRDPSVNVVNDIPPESSEVDIANHLIRNCIDKVYDAETVYHMNEHSEEEIEEFIDNLDVATYEKLNKFFETLPKMRHVLNYTNSKGTQREIVLSGLRDFFTWG